MNFSKNYFLRDRRVAYGKLHFLLRSVLSRHRIVDKKNKTITVDFWGPQLLIFFTEVMAFQRTVATTEWL